MKNIRNSEQFKKSVIKNLEGRQRKIADILLAKLMGHVLDGNPVEDGHAHEAWIKAILSLKRYGKFPKLFRIMDSHQRKRSNDPIAAKMGDSDYKATKKSLTVVISNNLPFVRKLEYGIPITVGDGQGNQGKKVDPVKRPPEKGPLYGKRAQGSEGLLVFEKGGRVIKAKTHTPRETGFVKEAVNKAKSFAKSNGLKVRSK